MQPTMPHTPQTCAFAPFSPLKKLPAFPVPSNVRPCICMNAKRNSGKRVSKGKRATSGSGFGSESTEKPSNNRSDATSDASRGVLKETASGAEGDATPHRAVIPDKGASLENPQEDLAEESQPLLQLPLLSSEQAAARRFSFKLDLDAIIEAFADVQNTDEFASTIVANRDFVSEALLYRFTSAILQVESRTANVETRDEEVRNMRALRKDLIAHCWSYDYPLKVALLAAEKRVLAVLQSSNVKKEVVRSCGSTRLDVNAFWIVIFAAVCAWEERGRENPELVDVDVQKSLTEAAEACGTSDVVTSLLSPALGLAQKILTSGDQDVQSDLVADIDDDSLAQIGVFTEQVRLFPTAAYGGLCSRLDAIVSYILAAKYNVDRSNVEPFRFELSAIERSSRLVKFSKKSATVKRQE